MNLSFFGEGNLSTQSLCKTSFGEKIVRGKQIENLEGGKKNQEIETSLVFHIF
jgi:hypothetical protein